MAHSIDHIVILVHDLAQASADYAGAGFTVTPGGEHTGGATHNTLISFADGAYFELIAFKNPAQPQEHRWWSRLAAGEGLVDYALRSDGLVAEADRLRAAGLSIDGPLDGGRLRPDGREIAWRILGLPNRLPFLIEDLTERVLRVPADPATHHPLGATGVASLTVAVADLAASAAGYTTLLGDPGTTVQPALDGVAAARRFPLGDQWLDLVQPTAADSELRRHLDLRGDGPVEIVLAGPVAPDLLPARLTHGVRIRGQG